MSTNPRLIALNGGSKGSSFEMSEGENSLGRESSNAVTLSHASVSRRHCVIDNNCGVFSIRDLDSFNGTFVNGIAVKEQKLSPGDHVRLGNIELLFVIGESEDTAAGELVRLNDADLLSDSSPTRLRPDNLLEANRQTIQFPPQERLARDLGVLLKIATRINRLRHTNELVREILDSIFEVVPVDRGAILLTQGGANFSSLYGKNRHNPSQPVNVSRTVVEQVIRERMAILTNDIKTHEKLNTAESLLAAQISSLMCVPLIVFEKTLGVIYLDTSDPIACFDEGHLELVAGIGGIAAVSLENARQMEWLEGENDRLRTTLEIDHDMVGQSGAIKAVYGFIKRVAPARSAVLICGESGTGKELAAHAIHTNSPRATKPFVPINCAALTETLLESELFGHEKGAFTGAVGKKQGKLEVANGGTVFLDEIGEMTMPMQSRLLRFLQDHRIEHLGGTRSIELDVRVLAATNRNLEEAITTGGFRPDLYHRLNVVKVTMPPLRERREDIPLLANHFAAKYAKECKRPIDGISPEAITVLQNYDWPGNVRELENAIERAVVLGSSATITVDDLPHRLSESNDPRGATNGNYYEAIKDAKRQIIKHALDQAGGNYTDAARTLGIHPNNLHRIIRTLDLKTAIRK